jgi:hypothetical protein
VQRFTQYTKQSYWWCLCASQDKRSFYEQFADLKGSTDLSVLDSAYPKPSLAALSKAPTVQKMPLSDVTTCQVQRPLLAAVPKTMTSEQAEYVQTFNFFWRTVGFVLVHGIFFSVSGFGPVRPAVYVQPCVLLAAVHMLKVLFLRTIAITTVPTCLVVCVVQSCWFTFDRTKFSIGIMFWVLQICFGINMCFHRCDGLTAQTPQRCQPQRR